jgi:Tol biopolymer transport system component
MQQSLKFTCATILITLMLLLNTFHGIAQDDSDITPDIGLIAFVSWHDGDAELYTINSDGTHLSRLTHSLGDDYTPAWSPDGEYLAFTSMRDGVVEGSQEIYVMALAESEAINISNSAGYDAYPAWSPDGNMIAFVSFRDANTEIYSMNADGTNQINLTNNSAEDMCPAWSPDGRTIAFSSNREGNFDIYILKLDDLEIRQVTSDKTDDYCPVWLPNDRNTLIYGAYIGNTFQMNSVSVEGEDQQPFDSLSLGDATPSWSPDSTQIAFTSSKDSENYDIYVIDNEGNEIRLTFHVARDSNPVWQPMLDVQDHDDN